MAFTSRIAGRPSRAAILALVATLAGCAKAPVQSAASPAPIAAATEQPAAYQMADPVAAQAEATQPLSAFYRDLRRLQAGQVEHVCILQLGDSHTAADVFSGYLRGAFQEKFGDSGRGMMPPGLAFRGLSQREVTVHQVGRWTVDNSLTEPGRGPYGISGFTATSGRAGARMSLSPVGPGGFDGASVDYLERPGGGKFDIWLDGKLARTVSTAGATAPRRITLTTPPGTQMMEIIAHGPGVTILDWSIDKLQRGVQLDSFGVVSATVGVVENWTPEIVRENIATIHPSLIILAFGTNEGFEPDFDAGAYREQFREVVRTLKRDAPDAAILVVGPPDGMHADQRCIARRAPLSTCNWSRPGALARVRDVQRQVAAAEGTGFWDWSSVMAPDGGIEAWVRAEPALARADHVHFTVAGYERASGVLFNLLMDGYQKFPREEPPKPPPAKRGRPPAKP